MVHLERLKESGLLIQGLDGFLELWMDGVPQSEARLNIRGESREIIEQLPADLRDFYPIIHRWLWDYGGNCLRKGSFNYLMKPAYTDEPGRFEFKSLADVIFHRGQGINVAIRLQDPYHIYTMRVTRNDTLSSVWKSTGIPADEFLVVTALSELTRWGNRYPHTKKPFDDSQLLFSGRYYSDEERWFYYHHSGILWVLNKDGKVLRVVHRDREVSSV